MYELINIKTINKYEEVVEESSITAISIHNATLLSCHFWKIATVSHCWIVFYLIQHKRGTAKHSFSVTQPPIDQLT